MPNRCASCHRYVRDRFDVTGATITFHCECGNAWSTTRRDLGDRIRGHVMDMADAIQRGDDDRAAAQAREAARLARFLLESGHTG